MERRCVTSSPCDARVGWFGSNERAPRLPIRAAKSSTTPQIAHDLPIDRLDRAIAGCRQPRVMRHDENRAAEFPVEAPGQLEYACRGPCVEVARRLIGEQKRLPRDQRASDGDPLLLAT